MWLNPSFRPPTHAAYNTRVASEKNNLKGAIDSFELARPSDPARPSCPTSSATTTRSATRQHVHAGDERTKLARGRAITPPIVCVARLPLSLDLRRRRDDGTVAASAVGPRRPRARRRRRRCRPRLPICSRHPSGREKGRDVHHDWYRRGSVARVFVFLLEKFSKVLQAMQASC